MKIRILNDSGSWATTILAYLVGFITASVIVWDMTAEHYDATIKRITEQTEKIKHDSQVEIEFWQKTLKGLADGGQLIAYDDIKVKE
jgi:hypothetical protein